ncbi:lipocalin-like domain-containing protein [Streptomyces specialis]|uniref:lipocalin-like domain-containing protein n=1 Tax=Streptomyces specialis TaxID=498367 RepID=UPI00073EA92E|nr:lipocalin-like domain-containing protein [Streptomyces specialis]
MTGPWTHPLVGVWTLLRFEVRTGDGRVALPFGPDATGLGVYTPGGLGVTHLTPTTGHNAHDAVAYAGRVTVDPRTRTLEQHVDISTIPTWVGAVLRRSYTLDGDLLTLHHGPDTADGTATHRSVAIWRRTETFG